MKHLHFSSSFSASWLILVVVSGCTAPDIDPRIVAPTEGSYAVYHGNDGSLLKVEVVGTGHATDPWLRSQPAIFLRYTYTANGSEDRFVHFEAIHPGSGAIVHQLDVCEDADRAAEANRFGCASTRFAFYHGAYGMPGLMGAAALWNADQEFLGGVASDLDSGAVNVKKDGRCHTLSRDTSTQDSGVRALPWTMVTGPTRACLDEAYPITFHTAQLPFLSPFLGKQTSVVYERVDMGGDRTEVQGTARPASPPVAPASAGEPPYANVLAGIPFSPAEAHVHAMAESSGYKAIMDAGGRIQQFDHLNEDWADFYNVSSSRTYKVTMLVANAEGALRLEMEKTARSTVGVPQVTYRIVSEEPADIPFQAENAHPQVNVSTLLTHARSLYPYETAADWYAMTTDRKHIGMGPWLNGPHGHRSTGVDVAAWFMSEGTGWVIHPHQAVMDGDTGAFIFLTGPASVLENLPEWEALGD